MNIVYRKDSGSRHNAPAVAILLLACGAQLMVVLDGLVVNIALPAIRTELGMAPTTLPWVVNAYLVTFSGLLLIAARATDLIGHRKVVLIGLSVFTIASLAGGLAQTSTQLILARTLQGLGAAALAPASLSLLTTTYTGDHRSRAIAIWTATSSAAGALGLVLGGILTSALGWRSVFLVNVPVGVLLCLLAVTSLRPAGPTARSPLDVPSAVAATVGAGSLTFGISQVGTDGWASRTVLAPLTVALVAVSAFLIVERRSPSPLVPLTIARRRPLILANVTIAGLGAIMTAMMYLLSLHLQQRLGLSAFRAGLALVPMSAVLTIGAFASKSMLPRVGAHRLVATGGVLMAAGLSWFAASNSHGDLPSTLASTSVWAAGASIILMPCVVLATSGVDADQAGLASGLINTARGIGGALGLAAIITIATAFGDRTAFLVAAAISVAIALLGSLARTPGSP